ncbi:MAG: cytochrome C peroxidase [Saprospiraceae bacterium]|uniref:Cytochrome C peroxidase n=1 Tax=Candidatus Opimibacter skivensis TaxID=2982028 RepID=A0A9D7SQS6_9BACT|nr:cytochrome C peroxidase [Candidatus Opimibacter skivensis]
MNFLNKAPGFYFIVMMCCIGLYRCHDTIDSPGVADVDLTHIPYQPIPYLPDIPTGFPALEQPVDNPMTIDGIRLGRKLFYDPILSIDSTISCSSCHQQPKSFTDQLDFSPGVSGNTHRSSISLLNVAFQYHGFFWDGRAATLELQALQPIENVIEMGESWENVETKLRRNSGYQSDFRKAFGIESASMINRDLATKAISQFERTIISGGNTRYDRFVRGEIFLNDNETNGYLMFFNVDPVLPDAQCGHCHTAPLFGTTDYFNNGLQESADLEGFADKGLGAITGKASDNGKFKTPTLRNLVFTAPYMHDGRFTTIQQVVEHYTSGGKFSPNKSAFLNNLHLTESQKSDLISFILTLTDSSVLTNPAYKNPF